MSKVIEKKIKYPWPLLGFAKLKVVAMLPELNYDYLLGQETYYDALAQKKQFRILKVAELLECEVNDLALMRLHSDYWNCVQKGHMPWVVTTYFPEGADISGSIIETEYGEFRKVVYKDEVFIADVRMQLCWGKVEIMDGWLC